MHAPAHLDFRIIMLTERIQAKAIRDNSKVPEDANRSDQKQAAL